MSLRARFALYAFGVVALTLLVSGLALQKALWFFLLRQVDRELWNLLDTALAHLRPDEEGVLRLDLDAELFASLRPDTLVLVVGPQGLQDALGILPPLDRLEALTRGEAGDYRVQARTADGVRVLTARHLGELRELASLVDRLLPVVLLLAGGTALLSALFLSSRALAPPEPGHPGRPGPRPGPGLEPAPPPSPCPGRGGPDVGSLQPGLGHLGGSPGR